ncbi:DNA-binding transcriptional LysR family regulator [Bradyrhizobium sp. AZCC 2289]
MILVHFAVSSARNFPNVSPESVPGSAPSSVKRFCTSGIFRIASTSPCSFASTGAGVLAGATSPNQAEASNPGAPDSATVGTSGNALARVAPAAAVVRGRLRINVDPFFARLVLAPRLGKFLAAYPELSVEIVGRDRLGDLVTDGFDAAVRFGEPEPSALVARRLLETRILTCAALSYLAKHGHPAHPRDLGAGRHECIHYLDPVTGRPFHWEFHRGRQKLRVAVSGRLTVNNVGTMLGACAAGHGVAQILALGTEDLLSRGKLIELFPDWSDERFPLYAFHLSRHVPPAKVRAFLDFVVGSVR